MDGELSVWEKTAELKAFLLPATVSVQGWAGGDESDCCLEVPPPRI